VEFERLMEVERRNESLLRQAHEDAAAVLASARDSIRTRRAAAERALATALAEREKQAEAERTRCLVEVETDAAARAESFRRVSDADVQAVAEALVTRLLGAGGEK
jgi:hypothetical protein